MPKRIHAGAKSKKHGCTRCHKHTRRIFEFRKKTGSLYTLCGPCLKATGREVPA
jgi:hypothetical protein